MSDPAKKMETPASPPEDAGRPFVFAAAQNVGVTAEGKRGEGEDDQEKEKNDEEEGEEKKSGPSSAPPTQIPMEFMHLQRSQSLRASRESEATGAAGDGRRTSTSSSAAVTDLGKRRRCHLINCSRYIYCTLLY